MVDSNVSLLVALYHTKMPTFPPVVSDVGTGVIRDDDTPRDSSGERGLRGGGDVAPWLAKAHLFVVKGTRLIEIVERGRTTLRLAPALTPTG